jgi:predicted AlkP superfamily pyrophosphatase or phosphodiesterase
MVCSFPTVTWPNHTTLVTGVPPAKHGVLGNSYLDRKTSKNLVLIMDGTYDKDEIVKVPTIYDAAHEAGLKTAGIIWPATRNTKSLDWTVPDTGGDLWNKYGTQSWLSELREAGLPVDRQGAWVTDSSGVRRDWLYTRMATQALEKHQPNLLLLHLVETDHVEHQYGPRSDEAYWATSYADDRLRDLFEAAQRPPLKGNTTIFICSDHGFFPINKEIRPNVILKQMGLLETKGDSTTKNVALVLAQGGGAAVYIFDDARRAELDGKLREQLGALPGVEAVIGPDKFARIGQPTRQEDPHGADFWLSAARDYSFSDSSDGDAPVVPLKSTAGTHGYLPENNDLKGTCVMWGAGIKPGANVGEISNQDVAPTIARLLGVELPTATGKTIEAALAK